MEKDKITAGFHLSQRGPGGYFHGGAPPMNLLHHQLSHKLYQLPEFNEMLTSILKGGRLPALAGKAFEQWTRPEDAWETATSVWMLAKDEDLEPWKAFCIQASRRKWPDGDDSFPEWVTGRRWIPGRGYVERSDS